MEGLRAPGSASKVQRLVLLHQMGYLSGGREREREVREGKYRKQGREKHRKEDRKEGRDRQDRIHFHRLS